MEEKKLHGNQRCIPVKLKVQIEGQAAYNVTWAKRDEGVGIPEREEWS